MSLNIKDTMQSIFSDLLLHSMIFEEQYDISYDNHDRWIKGTKKEAENLANSKIITEVITFGPGNKSAILQIVDKYYFCFTTSKYISSIPYNLSLENRKAGIIVSAIFNLKVPIKDNLPPKSIYNIMSALHDGISGYIGHDLQDVLDTLNPIYCFEFKNFDPNLNFEILHLKLVGSLISRNKSLCSLNFNNTILNEFENTFEYGVDSIPYRILLQAILAGNYKHGFIELYRCLESLYQVLYLTNLYSEVKPKTTFIEFLESVEKEINWRPIESQAIAKLINSTPSHVINDLNQTILKITKLKTTRTSKWIYGLRNNIVHLRQTHKLIEIHEKDWERIMTGILKLINYWFHELNYIIKPAPNIMYHAIV